MQVKPDGTRYEAWAIADAEGRVSLAEVCSDSDAARTLLKVMRMRQPHRRDMRAVPVTVSIRVKSGSSGR